MIQKNYLYKTLKELKKDGQKEKVISIKTMMNLLNTKEEKTASPARKVKI